MKRVLILAAHLDDSVLAMGGSIRKLVKFGAQVSVFCFGNGDEAYTQPGGSPAAVRRFKEGAEKAHAMLGVHSLECFDIGDFEVTANAELYRQCIAAIRKHRPDIIFGHWPAEYFQRHQMAQMSIDAWNQARWNCSADFGAQPWTAQKYFHFELNDLLPQPTHLVDVSAEFEDKMQAAAAYDAEGGHLDDWQDEMRARARYYGSRIQVEYAEAFKQSAYLPTKIKEAEDFFN